MIKISFIVPFYNVEQYIEECIRSLYNQDIPLEEYEVICVNDCSPDGSVDIVKRLQNEFDNLVLIEHIENKKLGGARNTGLQYAKGEYIWFVDSDDFIMPKVLPILLKLVEDSKLDILQFNHTRELNCKFNELIVSEKKNGEQYLFDDVSNDWYYKIAGAWKQIFKREFIISNKLRFIEHAMYEDTDFLLHSFLLAQNVQYISLNAYYYRVNTESITISKISPLKLTWRINLLVRCYLLVDKAESLVAKETITIMVSNTLTYLRRDLIGFTNFERISYLRNITPNISICRQIVSWRTWFAIRYAITLFIK